MLMDFDPAVRAVSSQPFWLRSLDEDDRSRRHAPDFFARRHDGSAVVIDVHPMTGSRNGMRRCSR